MRAFSDLLASQEKSFLQVGDRQIPLALVRNLRARRYLLRLRPDGVARVTVPRGGSLAEAKRFAERHTVWLAGQLQRQAAQPVASREWRLGAEILFRGERVRLTEIPGNPTHVQLGDRLVAVRDLTGNLRPAMEWHLRRLAVAELPSRVHALATLHGHTVKRLTVRAQRTRWGSCSRRATVSLNWRLIQTPDYVRDYIILHELMHLREMNHSARFWRHVETVCPDYQRAELWLKQNARLLQG